MQESLSSSIKLLDKNPFSLVLCLLLQWILGANTNSFSLLFRKMGWRKSTSSHQLPEFFSGRHVIFLGDGSSSSDLDLLGVVWMCGLLPYHCGSGHAPNKDQEGSPESHVFNPAMWNTFVFKGCLEIGSSLINSFNMVKTYVQVTITIARIISQMS